MDVPQSSIGNLVIEGKTKQVFDLKDNDRNLVFILSKDRITAGDGVKSHQMAGKSILSTQTNCAIFEFLSAVGIKTHYINRVSNNESAFVAHKCSMIPIEWVARRVATGSYLKRNPHVKEGYRFSPPLLETFFKDDANHDPYWSIPTIIGAKLNIDGLIIGDEEVQQMLYLTQLVFEVLERCWQSLDHSLIDMKIEFGVIPSSDAKNENRIVVADIIDNDSWRLWPQGDKRLMLDKQIYRNMDAASIDDKAIAMVASKFETVAQRTTQLFSSLRIVGNIQSVPVVAIIIGSLSDKEHAQRIKTCLADKYGITAVDIHVCSAHKSTAFVLKVVADLQQFSTTKAIIACAGRSNGLGPVIGANTTIPVLSCPPVSNNADLQLDIWSSLRLPTSMGITTIIGPENAALAVAHMVANESPYVWSRIRTQQIYTIIKMIYDDSQSIASH